MPPVPLTVLDDPSLAATAYAQLRGMLLRGELAPGQIIQERLLAEHFGLSRTPVRDALGRLEGERLLTRNGRALVVATITLQEVIDILQIRRLLESEAAYLAAGRMPHARIEEIRTELTAMEDGTV